MITFQKPLLLIFCSSMLLLVACQNTLPSKTSNVEGIGTSETAELAARWAQLKSNNPRVMIRDAAEQLNSSEAHLLATEVGKTAIRLRDEAGVARDIMTRVLELGEIQAITRNDAGVIETIGVPQKSNPPAPKPVANADDPASQRDAERAAKRQLRTSRLVNGFIGGPINLRLSLDNWAYAFAVTTSGRDNQTRRSLQFFNKHGYAVHKIYLNVKPENKVEYDKQIAVYDKIVADFRSPAQNTPLSIMLVVKPSEHPDGQIDVQDYQQAWNELTDVHQFNSLLTEFKLSREQSFRLAPSGKAQRIPVKVLEAFLTGAAKNEVGIMAFVGNNGTTQIFSGKIKKTLRSGPWYNVLDPEFNLHLREDKITHGWIVNRANIKSLEFFDKDGNQVVSFFAEREPRKPAPETWDKLLASLPHS